MNTEIKTYLKSALLILEEAELAAANTGGYRDLRTEINKAHDRVFAILYPGATSTKQGTNVSIDKKPEQRASKRYTTTLTGW